MNIDQSFPNQSAIQQSFAMQSQYMTTEAYKQQSHLGETQFGGRGMGPNYHAQELYQQEEMRKLANVSWDKYSLNLYYVVVVPTNIV